MVQGASKAGWHVMSLQLVAATQAPHTCSYLCSYFCPAYGSRTISANSTCSDTFLAQMRGLTLCYNPHLTRTCWSCQNADGIEAKTVIIRPGRAWIGLLISNDCKVNLEATTVTFNYGAVEHKVWRRKALKSLQSLLRRLHLNDNSSDGNDSSKEIWVMCQTWWSSKLLNYSFSFRLCSDSVATSSTPRSALNVTYSQVYFRRHDSALDFTCLMFTFSCCSCS